MTDFVTVPVCLREVLLVTGTRLLRVRALRQVP